MKTMLPIMALAPIMAVIPDAYGCSRNLTHLFWSPIIDSVSADCSFAGIEPNPSGIVFSGIMGFAVFIVIMWMRRR